MNERVPLGAALRVKFNLVVVSVAGERTVYKGRDFVNKAFASKAWRLDGAYWPVQGHVDTLFGFRVGGLDNVLSEEVQSAVDVLFAILAELVPDTPGAASSVVSFEQLS